MTTNKNVEKCLWVCVLMFVSYLFLGSFIIGKSIFELFYLAILYLFLLVSKISVKKK